MFRHSWRFIIRTLLVLKRSYNYKCGIYELKSERYRYPSSAFNNDNGETLNIALSRPSFFRELPSGHTTSFRRRI